MFEEVKELLISMLNSSFSATSEKSRNRKTPDKGRIPCIADGC